MYPDILHGNAWDHWLLVQGRSLCSDLYIDKTRDISPTCPPQSFFADFQNVNPVNAPFPTPHRVSQTTEGSVSTDG